MPQRPRTPWEIADWLLENTALDFDQVALGCGLPPAAVKALADGEPTEMVEGTFYLSSVEPWFSQWLKARTEPDPAARILARALHRNFAAWLAETQPAAAVPSATAFGRALSGAGIPVGGKDGNGRVWRQGLRLKLRSAPDGTGTTV